MGRGLDFAPRQNTAGFVARPDSELRSSFGAPGERFGVPHAHAFGGGSRGPGAIASGSLSAGAGDELQSGQRGDPGRQSTEHDHWAHVTYLVSAILFQPLAGRPGRPRHRIFRAAMGFSPPAGSLGHPKAPATIPNDR